MTTPFIPPEWAFEFHGHQCPFMPLGYRMAESRQRHAHMDRALKKLDEDSEHLQQAYNAQRQEDITKEIEVILLSAGMLEDECYGQQ